MSGDIPVHFKPVRLAVLCAILLAAPALAQTAPVQAPEVIAIPAEVPLSQSTFVLLPLRFEGHPELLSDAQRAGLVQSVSASFPAALARKYPQAHIGVSGDVGAVVLQPVAVVPPALSPFQSVTFRLELSPPQGEVATFSQTFSLWSLWLSQANALNLAWDGVLSGLPPQ